MTAVALNVFDQQPRTAAPAREAAPHHDFASLVDDQLAEKPVDPAKQLLDGKGQAHNDALLALLQTIPQNELPSGGIPEAIASEVSMVIDVPEMPAQITQIMQTAETVQTPQTPQTPQTAQTPQVTQAPPATTSTIATTASIAAALTELPRPAQPPIVEAKPRAVGSDLLPIAIEAEISDGIPTPVAGGPRPRARRGTDDDAQTLALPIPEAVRELAHARTQLMPIVDGTTIQAKPAVHAIPDAVPIIPALVAKLAPVARASLPMPQAPLTPLEQAVQDLIAELNDRDDSSSKADGPATMSVMIPEVRLLSIEHAVAAPTPVVAVRDAQQPEQANPSHVHLVIDDGIERVVVTVAVRGSEVNVALRGQDEATTAALARNAGSLDHALRGRGLDLASLMTQRDPDARQQRPDRDERRGQPKELFSIEDLA